jgi:hypothetical protein
MPGTFVHAVGALRTGNDPYLSINSIRQVTSANEIACMCSYLTAFITIIDNLITVCNAHVDIVEEKDGTFGATPMRSFSYGKSTPMTAGNFGMEDHATPMKQPVQVSSLTAAQVEEKVYQFIQSGKSTQWGFSKSDCVLKFKGVIGEPDVNKAIEQLLDDARIYDTGDETHFKSIE